MSSNSSGPADVDRVLVARQLARVPRDPWRVAARCAYGYPSAIVSPSVLSDSTPFPDFAWLTCPWLAAEVSSLESGGACAHWTARLAEDAESAAALVACDAEVRRRRADESGGDDPCAHVGLAGQRDVLKVKCLHAHVALSLAGLEDPIGSDVLAQTGDVCPDERCAALLKQAEVRVTPSGEDPQ